MKGRLVAACILAVLVAGGVVHGDTYIDESTSAEITFNLEQSVSGTGFYNTYQNISMGQASLSNINHGSGSYIYDANTEARADDYGYIGNTKTQQTIHMKESIDALHAGVKFDLKGSTGAIAFNSPITDLTCAKNYGQGASMNTKFLYAEKIKKDADASLYWNSNSSNALWEDFYLKEQGITSLNIESEFKGKAHIGSLMTIMGQKHTTARSLIDEDYSGEFNITKKMTLASYYNETAQYADWLPCCTGGWEAMDIHDQRGHGSSAKGIFDCTCYKVPDTAEFQRQSK
ncbi:MAG TPA: hypothetical protein VN455_10055 [Methanotrichaceae archaeon]|nr:hypothetical protein [Methanotrichaceae archaeon]